MNKNVCILTTYLPIALTGIRLCSTVLFTVTFTPSTKELNIPLLKLHQRSWTVLSETQAGLLVEFFEQSLEFSDIVHYSYMLAVAANPMATAGDDEMTELTTMLTIKF